jgi:hypothetical protein
MNGATFREEYPDAYHLIQESRETIIRIDGRLEEIYRDLKDLKDCCRMDMADHETRIRSTEKMVSENKAVAESVGRYHNKVIPKLEERIRINENWRWYVVGIAVGASVFLSIIITVLTHGAF